MDLRRSYMDLFFLNDIPDKLGTVDNPETSNSSERKCDIPDERYPNIFHYFCHLA